MGFNLVNCRVITLDLLENFHDQSAFSLAFSEAC